MWWPSFVSVLHDLWLFCTGRPQLARVPTASQNHRDTSYKRDTRVPLVKQSVVLRPGELYGPTHFDAIQIRSRLSAYDSNIVSDGPLTEYEWLLYNLQGKRLSVPLLALRLTPLGRWHSTLKGQSDISIGVTPYTNALVEWKDGDADKVGWVHEVSPDESVVIGQLGQTRSGLYEVHSYRRQEWLELRPVFTTFT